MDGGKNPRELFLSARKKIDAVDEDLRRSVPNMLGNVERVAGAIHCVERNARMANPFKMGEDVASGIYAVHKGTMSTNFGK